ncbi:hypothetical protein LCGC14_1703190 [marine sediment metagenome]|uniref:Uncharacterized protein n=1 Tax=marine sediment metagenome TaxID=412755 RepID=A0A0F9I4X1_9ZZZZ
MSKTHTPKPWRLEDGLILDEFDSQIAVPVGRKGKHARISFDTPANRDLAMSAPVLKAQRDELLAVCRAVQEQAFCLMETKKGRKVVAQLHTAIAKAEPRE